MKREILFRGKCLRTGVWRYGHLYNDSVINMSGNVRIKVIPETVGQFTGLTDKNGAKIFEGDKTSEGETVVFEEGVFGTTHDGNNQGVARLSEKRCRYIEII